MTDWNRVASTIEQLAQFREDRNLGLVADLCRRMARGELFTREQVDSAMNFARGQGVAEGREQVKESLT